MIKKLTSYLDYGFFAEASLIIFALVFVAIVIRTLMLRSDDVSDQARIVFGESGEEKP